MGFHVQRKDAFKRAALLPGFRLLDLLGFDRTNVRTYLRNRLRDDGAAERRFQLIERIEDLLGLSSTPRMLSFIVDLDEAKLVEAERRDGRITSAELYRLLIERWLSFEVERHQPPGAVQTLEKDDRFQALTRLAINLWERNETTLRVQDLEQQVATSMQRLSELRIDPKEATHIVGSGTLLTRDADGNFSFAHQSFLEWFVAHQAAEELKRDQSPRALAVRDLSPLMTDFFTDLSGFDADPERPAEAVKIGSRDREGAVASNDLRPLPDGRGSNLHRLAVIWAKRIATQPEASDVKDRQRANALAVLSRLGISVQQRVSMVGENLEGQDFSAQSLIGALFIFQPRKK